MTAAGERRRLVGRRSVIFRELTQMSYDGWDKFKSEDYKPLESELEQIKARLAFLTEMDEHLKKIEGLKAKFTSLE